LLLFWRALYWAFEELEKNFINIAHKKMAGINPRKIQGRWRDGFALDVQTVSSAFLGYDEYGHKKFDTKRSEIGELLYQIKYHSNEEAIGDLVEAGVEFLKRWETGIDGIIPVPPSKIRKVQPVLRVAQGLADQSGADLLEDAVKKTREVEQLKDVLDYDKRVELLKGIFSVDKARTKDRRLLLFDDLYRSGATMNEITGMLYDEGEAEEVFALTITCTRSNA